MAWVARRGQLTASAVAVLVLAACIEAPTSPPEDTFTATVLSCPEPCKTVIDRGARWEPAVAIDPRDGRSIVAASMAQGFDDAGVRYSFPLAHVSSDAGASWITVPLPIGTDAGATHPLASYNHADDPVVLFLPDGTLLYVALVFRFISADMTGFVMTSPSIAMWRSDDQGRTFPEARVLVGGSGFESFVGSPERLDQDKPWLAASGDLVLMVWNRNEQGTSECPDDCTRTFAASSRDAGASWSDPRVIYEGVSSGAFPLILNDGSWVVSYRETNDAAVHVAVSQDQGATWTTNTTIDATTKFPVLAKTSRPDGRGERVYMAYPMTSEVRGQPDVPQVVSLRWSDDGGRSWSDAVQLDATSAMARTTPAIAAVDGSVIVTYWYPTESEAGLGATLRAVAVSPSGAVSGRLDLDTHEGTTRTAGDYMGLVSSPAGKSAYAVWNARHGDEHLVTGARLILVPK